jgi:hypothetical protein
VSNMEMVRLHGLYEALSYGPPCAVEMKPLSVLADRDDDWSAM